MPVKVIVNGAGLVGALAAAMLCRRKDVSQVTVYERRADLRGGAEQGRSINLIITSRGLFALRKAGLSEKALRLCVPVKGRMMHSVDGGEPKFQPYGVAPNEVNYSVSRTALNVMLIDEAEKAGAKFVFEHKFEKLDLDAPEPEATYRTKEDTLVTDTAAAFFGTDGVASGTRQAIVNRARAEGLDVVDTKTPLGISYKEVSFPCGPDGKYCMDGDALHIWPRGAHFLMGLADLKNTFTGTLYLPDGTAKLDIPGIEEVPSFETLEKDPAKIDAYIAKYYPNVPKLVPDFAEQFQAHASGWLATIHCSKWNYKGEAVVLGDAAHGVVPFFGQGMNCGFESWAYLETLLDQYGLESEEGRRQAFEAFTTNRPLQSEAIAAMAEENFVEMSFKTGQPEFLRRKAIENAIERAFPHKLRSRYYMVVATLVPYATVKAAGVVIDAVVDKVISLLDAQQSTTTAEAAGDDGTFAEGPLAGLRKADVEEAIAEHVTPFLEANGIELGTPLKPFF